MKCNGIHCPGCGDGSGDSGGSLVGFIVLLFAVALIWRVVTAAMNKASEVGKAISADVATVLHVVLLVALGLGATAAAGIVGLVVWQLRKAQVIGQASPVRSRAVQPVARRSIESADSPHAIEQHLHFHGISPAEVAAIIKQQNKED
jgi:hypothetical protein